MAGVNRGPDIAGFANAAAAWRAKNARRSADARERAAENSLARHGAGAILWRYAADAVRGVVIPAWDAECPPLGATLTPCGHAAMSASDPKRKSGAKQVAGVANMERRKTYIREVASQ